jgi:Methyltransferase domain
MPPDFATRFSALSALLHETQRYWRANAFYREPLPWAGDHPDLVRRLLSLAPREVERLADDSEALYAHFADVFDFAPALRALSAAGALTAAEPAALSPRLAAGVPGRKWQQIRAFAGCVERADLPLLEWCAGKSHLGFLLQQVLRQPVTALEWDAALVEAANARAQQDRLSLSSVCLDVLQDRAGEFVAPQQHVVALHACGELHERLLQLVAEKRVQHVQLAPCCYHKRSQPTYTPLSARAGRSDLHLGGAQLHTAVSQTATAGATVRRQRVQLQSMRLGFDALQRDLRGCDEFLPVPSLPMSWARASFETFCRHCAGLKQLALPERVDWRAYEERGRARFRETAALDLVRFLFRRPLEIWLVLDRVLFLEEQGYRVEFGTFCPATVTPRNLLIRARR